MAAKISQQLNFILLISFIIHLVVLAMLFLERLIQKLNHFKWGCFVHKSRQKNKFCNPLASTLNPLARLGKWTLPYKSTLGNFHLKKKSLFFLFTEEGVFLGRLELFEKFDTIVWRPANTKNLAELSNSNLLLPNYYFHYFQSNFVQILHRFFVKSHHAIKKMCLHTLIWIGSQMGQIGLEIYIVRFSLSARTTAPWRNG